jgi:2-aminobenzoate-CoA ligase
MVAEIQRWFKEVAAPYKYPRMIHFQDALPKTETGKLQRYKLR